jgi:tetratricopeptide (TPR) repeat protein
MRLVFTCLFVMSLVWGGMCQSLPEDRMPEKPASRAELTERFSILVKTGENNFKSGGGNVDSFRCIQLNQIAQTLDNDSLRAIAYNWIGDYFLLNNGDNIAALEYFFKGLPLAEKSGDLRRVSSLYHDISIAYFDLENRAEALKYLQKMGENLPDTAATMYLFMATQYRASMANYFIQEKQPDSALHYVQALNELNLKMKSPLMESDALSLSGRLYQLLNQYDLAELYYQKANRLSDTNHFYYMKYINKKSYAKFLLNEGKIADAKHQGIELLQIGSQINNNDFKLAGAGFLRQVYERMKMTDSAYYYSKWELSLRDSLFNQNNINKIQALAFNEQIRLSEKEAKTAAEAEQRKENIQYVLITLGILTFTLFYLLLSRSFISNTKWIEFFGILGLLFVFEFLNLLLHPFLEEMTHHSPFWMLLSLVCIAGLLVPLHHRLETWATKKLVEKNRQIRLAAAEKTIQALAKSENEGA